MGVTDGDASGDAPVGVGSATVGAGVTVAVGTEDVGVTNTGIGVGLAQAARLTSRTTTRIEKALDLNMRATIHQDKRAGDKLAAFGDLCGFFLLL